jgi:hypothetical protein
MRGGCSAAHAQVLTAVGATIQHSANKEGRASEGLTLEGMRTAVGEHHAFGMTDFQVISYASGFGRTAAFRSLRTKFSMFTVGVPSPQAGGGGGGARANCTAAGHTTLRAANEHYSGI